eukprot:8846524-Heterocapsa_arctica.AAC.1
MAYMAQWDSQPAQAISSGFLGTWMGQILTIICAGSRGHKSDHWNDETRQQHGGNIATWKPRFQWQIAGQPKPRQEREARSNKN